MKALVTGSAGFIGRHMADELRSRGYDVQGVDTKTGYSALEFFDSSSEVFDLVAHCAAVAPNRLGIDTQPKSLVRNQLLDADMFDWAVLTGQRHVLYFSSCAVLDENPDDYGLLKLTGERLAAQARRAGLRVTVVRPFSGYGEDQSPDFPFRAITDRAKAKSDPFDIWGSGQQVRDWIHVDDVVNGALAVAYSATKEPVSLCTGVGTSMEALARLACAEMGYEPAFNFRSDRPAGQDRRVGDPTELLKHYTPSISLAEGVKRAFA